jgi:hypothetical protein
LTFVVAFLAAGLLFVPAPVSPLALGSLFLCGLALACLTHRPVLSDLRVVLPEADAPHHARATSLAYK